MCVFFILDLTQLKACKCRAQAHFCLVLSPLLSDFSLFLLSSVHIRSRASCSVCVTADPALCRIIVKLWFCSTLDVLRYLVSLKTFILLSVSLKTLKNVLRS